MVSFTEEHAMFRKTVRDFVDAEIVPHADDWERDGIFPARELFTKMGSLGLLGVTYDPDYGGGGGDVFYTAILGEEIGRMPCLGVAMAIAVQTDMATPSLHRFGSHELKERYLRPAVEGRHVAAIAVTEPDAGSDVAGIRTKAVRDSDEWVIDGQKLYITSGTQADWLCVLARTSDDGGYQGMRSWSPPTRPVSRSVASSTSWACGPPTRRSCASTPCGCRSRTPSERSAAGSNSRCSSSRTSG